MLKIKNGQVFDPANNIQGEVADLWIDEGKIVQPEQLQGKDLSAAREIDAQGCVVMPGGIEIHSHIAGTKVNIARNMRPEDHYSHYRPTTKTTRAGTGYTTPTTFLTGYEYVALGYTTAFEAAVSPLAARHAHEELEDTPILDNGMYTLMGNNHMIMKVLSATAQDETTRRERMKNLVTWMFDCSKGYAIKAVNPGGIEDWKWNQAGVNLDTPVKPYGVTSRQIIMGLAEASTDLGLPHGLHIHCNHLGEPDNYLTTLETMKALTGHRVHFTHQQFHAYGKAKNGKIKSAARELAEFMNSHPEFTCDAGQIVFGPATTMTADSPMQFNLHKITGNKWANTDVEMETGSGIVPMVYRPDVLINAVQWCIGLELLLLVKNPWQIMMSTDHPNAGPFTDYPRIIRMLMDADYRNAIVDSLHPDTCRYTHLRDITREYTVEEIAIITRSAPARSLGLERKGHLAPGADADIAIYKIHPDKEKMFRFPTHVLKDGLVVFEDGQIKQSFKGRRHIVDPDASRELETELREDFDKYYTVELANFPVEDAYVSRPEVIPCK